MCMAKIYHRLAKVGTSIDIVYCSQKNRRVKLKDENLDYKTGNLKQFFKLFGLILAPLIY